MQAKQLSFQYCVGVNTKMRWEMMNGGQFAGISITGMLSWIAQAANSFLEKLSSSSTLMALLKRWDEALLSSVFTYIMSA